MALLMHNPANVMDPDLALAGVVGPSVALVLDPLLMAIVAMLSWLKMQFSKLTVEHQHLTGRVVVTEVGYGCFSQQPDPRHCPHVSADSLC